MLRAAAELGFIPSGRARIATGPQADPDRDPGSEFFE